jgi:hypothetical protein
MNIFFAPKPWFKLDSISTTPELPSRRTQGSVAGWTVALLFATAQVLRATVTNQLSEEELAGGWKLLFDGKTTQGWRSFKKPTFPGTGWIVENTWLHCLGQGGGDIITDAEFGDFELQWEWKIAPGGNSGLKYFVLETRKTALGHEYQMIDDDREPDAKAADGKRGTAAFYDVLKPTAPPPLRQAGELNQSRIIVKGNHVEHWLNGKKVLEYSCSSELLKEAVSNSKFKTTAGFGAKVRGHLLLQDHGGQVWFRNLKIRPLFPVE